MWKEAPLPGKRTYTSEAMYSNPVIFSNVKRRIDQDIESAISFILDSRLDMTKNYSMYSKILKTRTSLI